MSDTSLEILRLYRLFVLSDKYALFKITPCSNLLTSEENLSFFSSKFTWRRNFYTA